MEIDKFGNPIGITREAFRIDDDGISTNWIEFDGGDFAAACLLLASVRVVRQNHRVGVMNVGAAINLGKDVDRQIEAIHDPIEPPDPPNPGHALLSGVMVDDLKFLDSLALLVELKSFGAEATALSKSTFKR
jgi:hypothetical protein